MMPSPYTSRDSLEDAAEVARLLGIRLDNISIEPAMRAYADMLKEQFDGSNSGVTEQNIQSRARGMTLMALSNKFGHMVLSTGNKSEMSVGYATLYGDMCGGYSVLKDVYKTTIFALCRWRNQALPHGARGPAGRVMPERVITKAPTAELKPDQRDEDDLPRYATLDAILECLVENEMSVDDIVARGHDRPTVERVWRMLDRAEYSAARRRRAWEDHAPRLRPRPPLSHHQRLPRRLRHGRARPLRAEPDGPAACRQHLHRPRQLAVRAPAGRRSCCASTTPTATARRRRSPPASRKTCVGSAWNGRRRCASPIASPPTTRPSRS
jgi:NAD+ synthetase